MDEIIERLTDNNSYVRTRAFMLICNQARWADKGAVRTFDRGSVY